MDPTPVEPDAPPAHAGPGVVGPGSGPTSSRTRLHGLLPVVVVLVSVALAASSLAVATRAPRRPTTATTVFLPADGSVIVEQITSTSSTTWLVSESARQSGVESFVGLPSVQGNAVISAADTLGVPLERVSLFRVTTHATGNDPTRQTTGLYIDAPTGIHQIGSFGGNVPAVYDPPLLVVPADHAVGRTWTARGDALPSSILTYDQTAEIVDRQGDCIVIESTLERSLDGELFDRIEATETWCPGSAARSARATFTTPDGTDSVTLDRAPDAPLPLDPVGDASVAVSLDFGDVTRWEMSEVATGLTDPFFEVQEINGTVGETPVTVGADRLVMSLDSGDDLVSYDVAPGALEARWRAHPGGELLSLAPVGEYVVSTTTDRRIVCHDAAGVQRWALTTRDLVLAAVTATPDGLAIAVGLDGAVTAIDVRTGEIRWRSSLVTDADTSAVVVGDLVVATDRSGVVAAFALDDGRRVWESEGNPVDVLTAPIDGLVVTVDDAGHAVARSAATGDEQWTARVGGFGTDVAAVAGVVVVGTDVETVGVDDSGRRLWRRGPTTDLVSDGDTVVSLQGDAITALDAAGVELARWDASNAAGSAGHDIVAASGGLWIIDGTGEVRALGDPGGAP